MSHRIRSVEEGSIAWQLGIKPGSELKKINGEEVIDLIDYQALCCDEKLDLLIGSGQEETLYSFEKDEYEPLGLEFYDDMLSPTRMCMNHCRFCFVDQLPKGVRPTMKVKDDDWRLSLMMGNYVTLTNVDDAEFERIIKRHASPLYISVHATDDAVRNDLIRPRQPIDLMGRLKRLAEVGIQFHTQAVVCPGINDGSVLEKTIDDLARLHPACLSLAVVPVGLTGHREGLDTLETFNKTTASALLDMTDKKRKELFASLGTLFVFPSDEMYLIAGRDFPSDGDYEDYAQIDNGVGMCRSLITEFEIAYDELPPEVKTADAKNKTICIACGVSVQPVLKHLTQQHPIKGVHVKVVPVVNHYFGPTVTVSGLITAGDLLERMRGEECEAVLITECMLRAEDSRFLDGMTLKEAVDRLGKPIIPVGRTGEDLVKAILHFSSQRKDSI